MNKAKVLSFLCSKDKKPLYVARYLAIRVAPRFAKIATRTLVKSDRLHTVNRQK